MMMVAPPPVKTTPGRVAVLTMALVCCALSGCASSAFGDVTSSLATTAGGVIGASRPGEPTPVQIFVASTRKEDYRVSDAVADGGVHHSLVMVSVPASHRVGEIERPTFGKPAISRDFTLTGGRGLTSDGFAREIATHISGRVGADRDVLVFVHGFNTSEEEARFRLAQMVVDAQFGGVPVLFTWPSQSSVFSYVKAKERATASRDELENLMSDLASTPGVGRVHLLAHSMGAWLTMEALRENAIAGRPDLDGKLGEVMLAAPDIDIDVFRNQMARLQGRARVSVLVSRDDRALDLSSRLAGDRPRVGALDPAKPADEAELQRLGVGVYDLTGFSKDLIGHGAYANTPGVIRDIARQFATPRQGESPAMAGGDIKPIDETPVADASSRTGAIVGTPLPEPVAAGR
jgi:esterase/lipase superfamily enzyme